MAVSPETRSPEASSRGTMNQAALTNLPQWDGSDPAGLTMLVVCDSSLGECILTARYLPLLAGRRARVIVECPTALMQLVAQIPGVEVASAGSVTPRADAAVSI